MTAGLYYYPQGSLCALIDPVIEWFKEVSQTAILREFIGYSSHWPPETLRKIYIVPFG